MKLTEIVRKRGGMFRDGGEEEEVKHGCNEVAVACRLAWGEGVGDSRPVVETCRPGEVKGTRGPVVETCRPGEVKGTRGPVVETCRPGEVKGTRGPVGTYTGGGVVGACEPAREGTCRSGEVVGTFEPAGEVTCRQGEVVDICGLRKVAEGDGGGGAAPCDGGGGAASRDDGGGAAPRDGGGARPFHVVAVSTGKPVEDVTVVGNCSWLPLD
ncbi:hypothetical protein Nepgr_024120 [Nepenthes gracilis]|uniref:Uncharacterized protein n=1 Tax=Nepenthes gracilis TaxID=150966 RepID=A0AAD3T5B7_NEPGR|nr:hypothetical protein Nepgr_024120 [Nepenthes gracilis]